MSYRHYSFLSDCLHDLNKSLMLLGQPLVIRVGDAVQVLEKLATSYIIKGIWSHQETGNAWTYNRDRKVKLFSRKFAIPWVEISQNGVVRVNKNRDGWAQLWYKSISRPIIAAPNTLSNINILSDELPSASTLSLTDDNCRFRQLGGRTLALQELESFLFQRGEHYTKEMSSPLTAYTSCSRLSAHLSFGNISISEVYHAAYARSVQVKGLAATEKGKWPQALRSFLGRLRWHCHFMQKLEDEPAIEFYNMHSAYNGLRESYFSEVLFAAWCQGKTGYPMIDACMRSLIATGWLNFRMRAMLMSFASYHLWLHWRRPALHLAKLFVDYEPGIHYSQVQMQSGTTGINAIRVYNPIKQSIDNDPDGVFIKKWLPELADVPKQYIHMPWLYADLNDVYPLPIVDEKIARTQAYDKIYRLRRTNAHKAEGLQVLRQHGSRRKVRVIKGKKNLQQGELL